jgi:hypothetical protein
MSNGFALWKNNSRALEWGELSLASNGTLTLVGDAGAVDLVLDLADSPYVDTYITPSWMCAVGAANRQLVIGHAQGPRLQVVGELERAERGDRFEFETHSVRFHDRPGHDHCILSWEMGVALVDPVAGLVWAHMHHDPNQRLMRITDATVELKSVNQAISVSLVDGAAQVTTSGTRSRVNEETLAHWMREIGR